MVKKIKCNQGLKMEDILSPLKHDGIVVLEDYFTEEGIRTLNKEFEKVFAEQPDKIEILDKEDVSKDKRIFHAERYSKIFHDLIYDNKLFLSVCHHYTGRLINNRKTLINLLEFSPTEERNSGAGWHRDNHDCQFKTIIYLTDVDEEEGNFQWITNSDKKVIGFPEPRTQSYNTRFHDKTIKKVLKENQGCKMINITGSAGTIIFANTTYIHRGNIIKKGFRRAITQYFF